jgi:hypothetical protein
MEISVLVAFALLFGVVIYLALELRDARAATARVRILFERIVGPLSGYSLGSPKAILDAVKLAKPAYCTVPEALAAARDAYESELATKASR